MESQGRHPSNIGLRRQQSSQRQRFGTSDHANVSIVCRDQPPVLRSQPVQVPAGERKKLPPSSRVATTRLENLKRDELVRQYYPSPVDNVSSTDDEVCDEGHDVQRAGTDSDGNSPPLILANPNYDVLPVVKTEEAKGLFDFYINSYATSIIEVSPQDHAAYSNVVHQILHDELLFTAFTTCSEAARWRTKSLYSEAPPCVSKGYGKTISLLRQRLQSKPFGMSPTLLLAMGQLVAIETMMKNVSATAKHLGGMQAAMKPKGTLAPPKGHAPVQTATDLWTQYFICRAMIRPTIPKLDLLTYPRHPFDHKLNVLVAELPAGFAEIAVSGRLSVQLLELLDRFNKYFDTIAQYNEAGTMDSPERTQAILWQAAYCIEYHQIQHMSFIERLILTALTAYVVRRDRVHPSLINIRGYFQITCAYTANLLASPENGLDQQDQNSDLLTWVGLMLLLTSNPEAHARKLALTLLPRRPEPIRVVQKCEQFFWDEDLTDALLSGQTLTTAASNDIIANNIEQALPVTEE